MHTSIRMYMPRSLRKCDVQIIVKMSCIIGLIVVMIIGATVWTFIGSSSINTLPPYDVLNLLYPDLDVRAVVVYWDAYIDTTTATTATTNTTTPLTGSSTTHKYELTLDDMRRIIVEYSFIWRYFIPANGLFGLIGNALTSAALLSDTKRPINGFYVYLVALAGSDSISLLISLYFWTVHCVFHHSLNQTECKLMAWMSYSSQAIGCWLISAIGVDRLTAVVKPLCAVTECTARRAVVVSSVLYIVVSLYYLPYLIWAETRNGICHYTIPGRYWKFIYPVLNMAMIVAPVAVMVYCNGRVAAAVHRRVRGLGFTIKTAIPRITLAHLSSTVSPGMFPSDSTSSTVSAVTTDHALVKRRHVPLASRPRDTSKDRHTLVILFLVTVVFLVFNLPYHVNNVLQQILGIRPRNNYRMYVVIIYVFMCAFYLNSSINFLLYCISASKFRRQVARLLWCRPKRLRPE